MGRNFVNGRLFSHVYTTEPAVAVMGLGIEKGGGKSCEERNTAGMYQFCLMVQRTFEREGI